MRPNTWCGALFAHAVRTKSRHTANPCGSVDLRGAPQQYDLLLRGGTSSIRVIESTGMDVVVSNGRIAAVQPDIPAAQPRKVLDVNGLHMLWPAS
jgi:hypothetical protein